LQIERRAYYRIDKVELIDNQPEFTLILVPDGKKVGLASIKTVTDKKGDIAKKDLAEKVEDKKNKGVKKEKKKGETKVEEVKTEEVKTEEVKTE